MSITFRLIWEFSVGGNVWTGQTHSEPRYSISAPVPAVGRQGSSAAVPSSSSSVLSLPSAPAIKLQNSSLRTLKRFTSCSIRPISGRTSCGPPPPPALPRLWNSWMGIAITKHVRCLGEARYQITEVSPRYISDYQNELNYGYEKGYVQYFILNPIL